MKKAFLLFSTMILGIATYGQFDSALRYKVPVRTFEDAVAEREQSYVGDSEEGGKANEFGRWVEWANNHRSTPPADGMNIFWPMTIETSAYIEDPGFYCIGSSSVAPHWKCVGPYGNYYNTKEHAGRVDFVWGDPANEAHILATANTGGLWETHDTGHKWRCLTDQATIGVGGIKIPGTIGINYLAVNPQNSDDINLQIGVPGASGKSSVLAGSSRFFCGRPGDIRMLLPNKQLKPNSYYPLFPATSGLQCQIKHQSKIHSSYQHKPAPLNKVPQPYL